MLGSKVKLGITHLSFFAGWDPIIFLKFGLNVLWSYVSMWLKYCVGLSMGLGYYINFRNKLHCMHLMIVVKLVVTCNNKNTKLIV